MTNLIGMARPDIKISLRTLFRHKLLGLIKVLGLAVGIAVTIVAYLILLYDLSYDRFHKDRNRIYRIVSVIGEEPNVLYTSGVPMPLGDAIRKKIPGVEDVAPFYIINDAPITISTSDQTRPYLNQKGVISTGPEFFTIFAYDWLAGTPAISLTQPYQVVLTKHAATLYYPGFPLDAVVGQKLILRDSILTTVSGIVDDLKGNTDLTFNVFVSGATFQTARLRHPLASNWAVTIGPSQLFVKLVRGYSLASIRQQLEQIYREHAAETKNKAQRPCPYQLQPLADLHFDARFGTWFGNRVANKTILYGLLAGAIFLLLLACINMINISTAQSSDRAKEIAVRKTLGASKMQLIGQFLTETFVTTLTAGILSLVLVPVTLRLLAHIVPAGVVFNPIKKPSVLLFLLLLTMVVTFFSGMYPAWILARYSPVRLFKQQIGDSGGRTVAWLRRSLVVTQFVISQVFVTCVLFVGLQLRYTLNKDLGFRKNAVVYFEISNKDTAVEKKETLLDRLQSISGVERVSLSNGPASSNSSWSGMIGYSDGHSVMEATVQQIFADTNFLPLFDIPVLAGSNIQNNSPLKECVINVACCQQLGFRDINRAIGKLIRYDNKLIEIVGVMSNFYQESLYEPIKPVMLMVDPGNERVYNVALRQTRGQQMADRWKVTIDEMATAFKDIYPRDLFTYDFQDDTIAQYYQADIRFSALLKYLAVLTVFISSMGLLGFIIYSTNKRLKEISIRKVLGASIGQIIQLFLVEFILLTVIAFAISIPISYLVVHDWLKNFAYRISMSWWIFGVSGVISGVIAMLTIAIQATKAAVINPSTLLKAE